MRKLLNVKEVAEQLGIARGTIYNLVAAGKMPAVRVFGALRFDQRDIDRIIAENRINQNQTENGERRNAA